jgi:hypothetical protein
MAEFERNRRVDRHHPVSGAPHGERVHLGRAALVALALALGLGALVSWLRSDERKTETRAAPAPEANLAETRAPPVAPTPPSPAPASAAPPEEPTHELDAHAEAPGQPSHPITPEHLRVYRENHFIHGIDNAILAKDYAAIRRFNAEYRKEYPADGHALQDAYEMIADCLEEKTPERVERARKFWETRRSSQARRDLRRTCLE